MLHYCDSLHWLVQMILVDSLEPLNILLGGRSFSFYREYMIPFDAVDQLEILKTNPFSKGKEKSYLQYEPHI